MKKPKWLLAALALAVILGAGIGQAVAYFTSYTEALGGYPIYLGNRTEITEEFNDWTKRVVVHNEAASAEAVWIRVKAFSSYDLVFDGADWSAGEDGYYYYAYPVEPGTDTGALDIRIGRLDAAGTLQKPEPPEEDDPQQSFDVIVIYESTPVRFGTDGSRLPADWNEILDTGRMEGGETE